MERRGVNALAERSKYVSYVMQVSHSWAKGHLQIRVDVTEEEADGRNVMQ